MPWSVVTCDLQLAVGRVMSYLPRYADHYESHVVISQDLNLFTQPEWG